LLSLGVAKHHIAGELVLLVICCENSGGVVWKELNRDAKEALEEEEKEDQEVELCDDVELVTKLVELDRWNGESQNPMTHELACD
jgi:hypothetical protein